MASVPQYGPFQPAPPQPSQSQYPNAGSTQSCYNCGSSQHWAQFCPEPRRQVPAGSLSQKARPPSKNKKGSKPVITRYAPPPGYVPPQPPATGAPPPPPPPPVVTTTFTQPGAYPAHGASPYTPNTPTTPQQWQPSPQTYTAPPAQWPQQTAPTYGPHPPPAQPGYGGYGAPVSPYAAQSPVQAYPPQPTYSPSHLQPPQSSYQTYNAHQQPLPPMQTSQSAYPPPTLQVPPYPQTNQFSASSPQFSQPKSQSQNWQPYQPPPQTNYQPYQQNSPVGPPYPRSLPRDFSRQNGPPHHGRNRGPSGAGRVKPFQAQQPPSPENVAPRPPSPPRFFPHPHAAQIKTRGGSVIWRPPQPIDIPLGATYEETEEQNKVNLYTPSDKDRNVTRTKYYDLEGKRTNQDESEHNQNDPVWISARTGGSTRIRIEGYALISDSETEGLINQLKINLAGEPSTSQPNSQGDAVDPSGGRKSGAHEGKKRNWDEFVNTNKPGQDQDRRPNKRRHGNDGRNRRNNRHNRHGNKGAMNRSPGRDTAAQQQTPGVLQPPLPRVVHPLPPKPMAASSPASSHVDPKAPLGGPAPNSHHNTTVKSELSAHWRIREPIREPEGRRSTSPTTAGEGHTYRQRDYHIKQENDSSEWEDSHVKHEDHSRWQGGGGIEETTVKKEQVPENADVRRRGSAVMEVYSRRW